MWQTNMVVWFKQKNLKNALPDICKKSEYRYQVVFLNWSEAGLPLFNIHHRKIQFPTNFILVITYNMCSLTSNIHV